MIVVRSTAPLREAVRAARAAGRRIALVPTMGNLHAGHARLVRAARERAGFVAASIYVNPLQFGPREDLAAYPRTPAEDERLLAREGADLLFMPDDDVMYPRGTEAQTTVEVPGLGDILCGAARPGHFRGVATVVNRLFNLVQPDVAVFGKKDYQQLLVIRRMVEDLAMPVEIVGVETVRESDGLALSSRNGYLNAAERAAAPGLIRALRSAATRVAGGDRDLPAIEAAALAGIEAAGFRPEYVCVRRQHDLEAPAAADTKLVILVAAQLGRARLIDNIEIDAVLQPDSKGS
jgi:pantoate--beta-alanine ligase